MASRGRRALLTAGRRGRRDQCKQVGTGWLLPGVCLICLTAQSADAGRVRHSLYCHGRRQPRLSSLETALWRAGFRMRVMGLLQGRRAWAVGPPQTLNTAGGETSTRPTTSGKAIAHHGCYLSLDPPSPSSPSPQRKLPGVTIVQASNLFPRPRLAMAQGTLDTKYHAADFSSGGTGARFARAVIIVAGVCALVASLVTFVYVSKLPSRMAPTDVGAALSGYKRERPPRPAMCAY